MSKEDSYPDYPALLEVKPGEQEGTFEITLRITYPQNPDFIGNEVEVQCSCSIRDEVSVFEFNQTVPVVVGRHAEHAGRVESV